MDISFSGFMSSFIFGVFGIWLFRQGIRRANYVVMLSGVGLIFYPYFTTGPLMDWGIGIILCGLAYRYWNMRPSD